MLFFVVVVVVSTSPVLQFVGGLVYLMVEGKMPREAGKQVVQSTREENSLTGWAPTSLKWFTTRRENLLLFPRDAKKERRGLLESHRG